MGTSLKVPFSLSGGRVQVTADQDKQIEQKIANVLVVDPAERVGIPDYGSGINAVVFEPLDDLVLADFKTDIGLEVSRRVSGVTIGDVQIHQDGNDTAIIKVYYSLPIGPPRELTIQVAAPYSLTEESPLT